MTFLTRAIQKLSKARPMITRVLQSLRATAWHPSDEQLVAFIDAELGPRESARVRRHIAHCWACRGRERKLAETIDAFMDALRVARRRRG